MNNLYNLLDLINVPIYLIEDDEIVFKNNEFNKIYENTNEKEKLFIKNDINIGCTQNLKMLNKTYNKLIIPINEKNSKMGILLKIDSSDFSGFNMFQTFLNSIPEIIFCKDNNLKYTIVNDKCKEFYNDLGIDNIIGKTDLDFDLDKEFLKKCNDGDKKVLETKKAIYLEEKIMGENFNYRVFQTIKTPIIDENGNMHGIIGSARDITKQKELEEKLIFLSYKDSLTGLYNRTYFQEEINNISKQKKFRVGVVVGDLNGLKLINDTYGHTKGDTYIATMAKILEDIALNQNGIVFRWGGDEFITLLSDAKESDCKNFIEEIKQVCEGIEGLGFNLSISQGYAIFDNENNNIDEVIKKADEMLYKNKENSKRSTTRRMLDRIKDELYKKGIESANHTNNVVNNCIKMAEIMNLRYDEIQKIRLLGLMHDIGKSGIDEKILLKKEKLTDIEYNIVKSQVEIGHKIATMIPQISHIAKEILSHHERWDGKGYPNGLKEEEIPLLSRILSVVHSYDVMTEGSAYKQKITKQEAIKILKENAGTQFDPNIVDIFINNLL